MPVPQGLHGWRGAENFRYQVCSNTQHGNTRASSYYIVKSTRRCSRTSCIAAVCILSPSRSYHDTVERTVKNCMCRWSDMHAALQFDLVIRSRPVVEGVHIVPKARAYSHASDDNPFIRIIVCLSLYSQLPSPCRLVRSDPAPLKWADMAAQLPEKIFCLPCFLVPSTGFEERIG